MSASTPARVDKKLVDAAMTASRVLVGVAARSLSGYEDEVSLQQYRALVVLASRGPQRPADLAEALGIEPSTVTRLCDRLVEKRLISRRRETDDRRVVRLDLTKRGGRLIDAVTDRRRQEIAHILAAVSTRQRVALVHAFEAFGAAAGEVPEEQWARSWDL